MLADAHILSLGYLWLCFIRLLTSKSNHSQLHDAGSAGSSVIVSNLGPYLRVSLTQAFV